MKRLWLLALLVAGCSSKGPYATVEAGKKFPFVDSLPAAMKHDDWKTVQWANVDAKPMTKEGGSCTGHAGVLERDGDKKHWIIAGIACNGTAVAGNSGERFEAHPIPTKNEKDVIKMDARFVELLQEGVHALWVSTTTQMDGTGPDDVVHDQLVVRRNAAQVQTILELTSEGVLGTELEGGFPKTFVVKTRLAEQRLVFKDLTQKYAHDSIRGTEYKSDGGTNSAEHLYGDGGVLLDAAVPFGIHSHHDP